MSLALAHPRNWPTWAAVGCAWCLSRLPLGAQFKLGRAAGALFYTLGSRRRHIAAVNIGMCFPELTADARQNLVKETFAASGISLVETARAWLGNTQRLVPRHQKIGFEHVQRAHAKGRGVLLLGAHFSVLDLAGPFLAADGEFDVIYRANKNPVIEAVTVRGRRRHFGHVVERRDVRSAIRLLRQNRIIWYAADQDYGRRHSVFAPFFGVEAATISAAARLARANQSPVVFGSAFRDESTRTWTIRFTPVENFPSGDDQRDAGTVNALIEAEVRRHPEQYFWIHRRFKTRPDPADYPYGEKSRKHSRKRRATASMEKRSATR